MTSFEIPYAFSASILAAQSARLGEEASQAISAGAALIHIDVMDNHYVPNLTFGPMICQGLRDYGVTAPMDVHLMVKPVDDLIIAFAKAGATTISIHPESTEHLDRSLSLIQDHGCQAGLAFNPTTPLHYLDYTLHLIHNVLIMSVNPGFTGQRFISSALTKIAHAHARLQNANHPIRLTVDGGVNPSNVKTIADAGANTFVVGAALFHQPDYHDAIASLHKALKPLT
jgi:ribulose-phosphate 3-epimerase